MISVVDSGSRSLGSRPGSCGYSSVIEELYLWVTPQWTDILPSRRRNLFVVPHYRNWDMLFKLYITNHSCI